MSSEENNRERSEEENSSMEGSEEVSGASFDPEEVVEGEVMSGETGDAEEPETVDTDQVAALAAELEAARAERDIVVLSELDDRTPSPLRQGFQPGGFKLVLVGKDGGVKLEQDAVLAPEELFAVIDRMPMRRNEMRD